MHLRARLLIGLLLLAAGAALAFAAEDARSTATEDALAQTSTQECKTCVPVSNGPDPAKFPASPPAAEAARAADVVPMSWSNVKALWG